MRFGSWIALGFVFVLAACGDSLSLGDGSNGSQPLGGTDNDAGSCRAEICDGIDNNCDGVVDNGELCASGQSCVNGACVGQGTSSCASNAECASGQVCVAGVCQLAEDSGLPQPEICDGIDNDGDGIVDNDAYCAVGQCIRGACMDQQCNTDTDCATEQLCVRGVCMGQQCGDNSACPVGQVCMNGACVVEQDGGPLEPESCDGIDNDGNGLIDDGDLCGAGLSCVNGACVSQQQCGPDSQCPVGQFCMSGVCVAQQCDVDSQCPVGYLCVNRTCIVEQDAGPCQAESCDGIDNDCDGVVDNGDLCGAGLSCVNGACVAQPQCGTDSECGPGQVCVSGACFVEQDSGMPGRESCDGIDNDGDGLIDNGAVCPAGQSCLRGTCVALP